MHSFSYRGNQLYCENIKLIKIVEEYGSPLFVYSKYTLIDHFLKLKNAFKKFSPLICFSVKSNNNLALLKLLIQQGAGMDIVSGGELFKARKAGCPAQRIVYAGVGKNDEEIEYALRERILFFNVESPSELERINKLARKLKRVQDVCLRLNPEVEAKTHGYIKTASPYAKFGMPYDVVKSLFQKREKFPNLRLRGIHIHIGSQITEIGPFLKAIRKVLKLKNELDKIGIEIDTINIGGGLGIIYKDEKAITADIYAKEVEKTLASYKGNLILEPGRFIVGNAGVLITKVLYKKTTYDKRFLIVDAGMNLLIRPALYSAYHDIEPLIKKKGKKVRVTIAGPICESADFLGKERLLGPIEEGNYLAVFAAGAYGFSMASNYNCQLRCAEVLVDGDKFYLIREREFYRDLIAKDRIPLFLK